VARDLLDARAIPTREPLLQDLGDAQVDAGRPLRRSQRQGLGHEAVGEAVARPAAAALPTQDVGPHGRLEPPHHLTQRAAERLGQELHRKSVPEPGRHLEGVPVLRAETGETLLDDLTHGRRHAPLGLRQEQRVPGPARFPRTLEGVSEDLLHEERVALAAARDRRGQPPPGVAAPDVAEQQAEILGREPAHLPLASDPAPAQLEPQALQGLAVGGFGLLAERGEHQHAARRDARHGKQSPQQDAQELEALRVGELEVVAAPR